MIDLTPLMARRATLWCRWIGTILAVALCLPESVGAAGGVQISPDGKQTLVNKAVGSERWAIARNVGDGSLTGNIFNLDGRDPQFVWCDRAGTSGEQSDYRCYGAEGCKGTGECGTLDQWSFISDVTLPEAFFSPSSSGEPTPIPGCSSEPGQRVRAANSDWVVVEVPVTLEGSAQRYALRYPVRLTDGVLASSIQAEHLGKATCGGESCPLDVNICGHPARVSTVIVGDGTYSERAGYGGSWNANPSGISVNVSILIDPAFLRLSVRFQSFSLPQSAKVASLSDFNYSLLQANYPSATVDAQAIRAELESLLPYITIIPLDN